MIPPAHVLVYLFADRVTDPRAGEGPARSEMQVPCSEERRSATDVATTALASIFWSLRDRRLIALEVKKTVRGEDVIDIAGPHDAQLFGLEGRLLDCASENELTPAIANWFGVAVPDPYEHFLAAVRHEAADYGYLDESNFEPLCAQIAELDDRAADLAARWRTFHQQEADLCSLLLASCGRGLEACAA